MGPTSLKERKAKSSFTRVILVQGFLDDLWFPSRDVEQIR